MTRNGSDAEKRAARALQRETGMTYTQALEQVRREWGAKQQREAGAQRHDGLPDSGGTS